MSEVVRLVPETASEDWRCAADEVLEAAKGRNWHRLMVIGELEDEDGVYITGTANAGETLILMERAKMDIIGR